MESAATCHLRTWERFVQEGVLESSRLNKQIEESWYRCKKEQVNPYLNKGRVILTTDKLNSRKKQNNMLLEAARPHLMRMDPFIKDTGLMALLVDKEGYVLSLSGGSSILKEAEKINFVEGVRWTETEVGTNAIGTALYTGQAIMLQGSEHYAVASHRWSCAAMPIYHENVQIGVIDLSCPVETFHPAMMGIAASLAYAIEKELAALSYQKELFLIRQSIEMAETFPHVPFIVCDEKDKIVSGSKKIREKVPQAIGMYLPEFLQHGYHIKRESCVLTQGDIITQGKCLFLSESKPSQKIKSITFKGESGTSKVFQDTLQQIQLVAQTDMNVFISGETGVGKELIARAIHENSNRKKGPFLSINCGALPKDLIESELFGYEAGAFTGAKLKGHKGKFEQAKGGTIFLDEIGDIPLDMQVTLLRVLQERTVTPIGGTKCIPLDFRIITATHKNLKHLVADGSFREDLYYRLHVYPIHVPSLKERKEDIPHLASYLNKKHHWQIPLTHSFLKRLTEYDWPGNVRELQNVLQRLSLFLLDEAENIDSILDTLLPTNSLARAHTEPDEAAEKELTAREKIQKDIMLRALEKTKGNVTAAAKLVDIPRSTFYKRLQKYGL